MSLKLLGVISDVLVFYLKRHSAHTTTVIKINYHNQASNNTNMQLIGLTTNITVLPHRSISRMGVWGARMDVVAAKAQPKILWNYTSVTAALWQDQLPSTCHGLIVLSLMR